MIPLWLRPTLKNAWSYLTFKYTLIAGLCLWAMSVQMQYRVPSRFLFLLLPWIGIALSALSFILLVNHLLGRIPATDPFRQTLRRVEWWGSLLIRVFIYYSLFLYANGKLDRSFPVDHASEALQIAGAELDLGRVIPVSWVELRSWQNPEATQRVLLRAEEEQVLWPGQPVVVQVRQGYFKVSWISRLERDEEKYNRKILELAPTASIAWKRLVNFYLDHQRWNDAIAAAHDYLKIYPDDHGIAFTVGGVLSLAGHYSQGVPFLESAVARRPTYEAYQMLGWALSYQGNKTRAAEVLEASIPLNPVDWEAYYHLGYVYSDMGRYTEAVAMFEKVLQRRPHFPEVDAQLASLRQRLSAQRSKQQSK